MKESIVIKNLGPLKDISIEEIKPFTVFIGESGSGKSTLMKVISLFRWIYKMQNIHSYLIKSNVNSPFEFDIYSYFESSGIKEFIKPNTEIIYKTTFDKRINYEIKFHQNTLYFSNQTINESYISFNKISFITETRNIIALWANIGASLTGGNLGFYFHEVFRDFNLASDAIKNIELNHLGLKFSVKKSDLGKNYRIESDNNEKFDIEFKNSSSGTQTSVPILLISEFFAKNFKFEDAFNGSVLKYLSSTDSLTKFKAVKNLSDINKKIYIHIEEPELSLFPDAQCKLMDNLVENCFITNTNPVELLLSTHSPYIVNYLNLLIKKFDKNVDEAKYNYDELAVYQVADGGLINLMAQNERLVNTNPLSDTINDIYNEYEKLG
ncbi:AAA family ATPase [Flavobacterium sp. HJJ]|uniref:AAA family ATPase n=1 Tax=Flavobacterium sp. HJJ TaxID=2783792 RepID=UPI00188D30B0|nr:AAA family ATPase [Flavobacterium sp. HJJ]MBF4470848.1 AAA family ATPase [Flavobacterium sp. HJJ]